MKNFHLAAILLLATISLHAKPLSLVEVKKSATEIDRFLAAGYKKFELTPTAFVDEPTFLRRCYLGISGRIPTSEESQFFLDSKDPQKREKLIESLSGSAGQKSKIFNYYADLLRVNTRLDKNGLGWHVWLQDAVKNDMPYDKMVHDMLAADGDAAVNPAVGYYLRDRGMLLDNVSNTVQVFLGNQIGCAQCHDHPFDKYTQMDYYQLASYLGSTTYRSQAAQKKMASLVGFHGAKKPIDMTKQERRAFRQKNMGGGKMNSMRNEARDLASIFRYQQREGIFDSLKTELKLPENYRYKDGDPGEVVEPRTIFGPQLGDVAPEKRREAFAAWVTSPENPFFTKVIANRLWSEVFGAPLAPTLDDWTNMPAYGYPELMDHLEVTMKACQYDVTQFLRILYHTELFQREVAAEEPATGYAYDFAGPVLRRMSAEEIHDSLLVLTRGDIDTLTNDSLKKSWDDYVDAYRSVMAADKATLQKVDDLYDKNEAARNKMRKERTQLATKARVARESGDTQAARDLYSQLKSINKKDGSIYRSAKDDPEVSATIEFLQRRPRGLNGNPFLRASEQPTPFQGGTIVREFGGSDRETPSAGNTAATVPQALRLLNGRETEELISRRRTKLGSLVKINDSSSERLEALFLGIYSAYPTAAEKTKFKALCADEDSFQTLARAMLTSNRFLFVQ